MEVQTVSCNRCKIRAEVLTCNARVVFGLHRLDLIHGISAVAATKRQIIRTVDDGDGLGVIGCAANASQAVQLAESDCAFGLLCFSEDTASEARDFEEADLVRDDGAGDEEAVV
jgi:hypothetical protein